MTQYIDKAVVVAEIKRMRDKACPNSEWNHGYVKACESIISFLNTFEEIEEIGVDIVKRMHNTPLDNIKFLNGHREANKIEKELIGHIGEEYWHRVYKNSK